MVEWFNPGSFCRSLSRDFYSNAQVVSRVIAQLTNSQVQNSMLTMKINTTYRVWAALVGGVGKNSFSKREKMI